MNIMNTGTIVIDIREMSERDVDAASRIETGYLDHHTRRKNLLLLLRRSDCRGAVAEHQKRVLGFLIYRFLVHRFYIVNFATRLDFRRLGVASGMIKYLKSGISLTHTRIAVDVRETNLSAQFFLAKNGFRAVHVNEGYFQDTKESSYRMYFP